MKKKSSHYLTRRNFLGRSACSAMALTGVVDTLAHLRLMQSALAQGTSGYKALIVLFLYGGNDSNNTLIPRIGHPEYDNYKSNRGILGILDQNDPDVNATVGSSIALSGGGDPYGVHPNMQPVADLYAAGDLSFVANVGTLSWPITRPDYLDPNKAGLLPPQLYSHSDQQIQWQSSIPDQPFRTGWGGRVADLLEANQGGSVSLSISLAGINSLQVGGSVAQYAVTPNGAIPLSGYGTNYANALDSNGDYILTNDNGRRLQAFDQVTEYTHAHLLEQGYNDVVKTSRENEGVVSAAVDQSNASAIDAAFAAANATSGVADQLKMISKLISGRGALNNDTQIFFCAAGGYDTHQSQISAHGNLMRDLANALAGFQSSIDPADKDKVLLMTHSDFTRTLTPNGTDVNGSGSDHGWGGHQIVMGGPVDGGKVFGSFPQLVVNGGIDAGTTRGRWIPSTSVDQYSSIAANWLGVSDLSAVFPNLGRFDDPFGGTAGINYIA